MSDRPVIYTALHFRFPVAVKPNHAAAAASASAVLGDPTVTIEEVTRTVTPAPASLSPAEVNHRRRDEGDLSEWADDGDYGEEWMEHILSVLHRCIVPCSLQCV